MAEVAPGISEHELEVIEVQFRHCRVEVAPPGVTAPAVRVDPIWGVPVIAPIPVSGVGGEAETDGMRTRTARMSTKAPSIIRPTDGGLIVPYKDFVVFMRVYYYGSLA